MLNWISSVSLGRGRRRQIRSKNVERGAVRRPRPVVVEQIEGRILFSTYLVTTTADGGAGSLRDAIVKANATTVADVIQFKIGTGGLKTITPTSALPTITRPLTIDGTTQGGYAGKPLIELRGDKAGSGANGLSIAGGSSTVNGLIVNRFGSNGILITGGGGNTIKGSWIGLANTGTSAAANGAKGIVVATGNNTIGGTTSAARNVLSGNASHGIQLYSAAAKSNVVLGNYIGTNAAGTMAVANRVSGVAVYGASYNTIGGTAAGSRNVISGNLQNGVVINGAGATNNVLLGNYVGLNAAGNAKVGNGAYGVEISQPYNTVGSSIAGGRNVISGNGISGVVLWLSSAHHCKILGNYIGTNATGNAKIGNATNGIDVSNGAGDNVIGGATAAERNVISGNTKHGVLIYQGQRNTIRNNTIGLNAARTGGLGNVGDGIHLTDAKTVTISYNLIGHSGAYAILKTPASTMTLISNTITNDTTLYL